MSNCAPPSHFPFNHTALCFSQHLLLPKIIFFFVHLFTPPGFYSEDRKLQKVGPRPSHSPLNHQHLSQRLGHKWNPRDLFSARAVGRRTKLWGVELWNCKFYGWGRPHPWPRSIALVLTISFYCIGSCPCFHSTCTCVVIVDLLISLSPW